ncbi:MAG: MATE family efflux transporter [Clostridia bacterium]|nr:MATE family efflux transporter [Clostridia bacterium]
MKKVTVEGRKDMMLNQPLNQVIPRLAVPTIISMLVTAVYNMADTYFVARISTEASAAVGVVFSMMAIIQAMAFTIGMGSGANVSQALGAGREEDAKRLVAVGFFTAFAVGIVLAVAGNIDPEGLVVLIGATPECVPDAVAYARYIFMAAPFMMCSFVMNNHLRFQGMAMYAMIGISSGGILNMLLDPLLIFGFHMGTAGAAIATAISQTVSFTLLLTIANTRKGLLHYQFSNFKPTAAMYRKILYTGVPSLGRQGIAAVATIFLNRVARGISPDSIINNAAIAAMSISNKFVMFINSAVIGFGQGFQPVAGFCYGAGRYRRVREAYVYCGKVATIILLCLAAVAMVFSEQIIRLFRGEDPMVVSIGTGALRMQLVTLPLWGFYVMANMCTQSIGYGLSSTVISSARQGIFLIPSVLILPALFGITGLQAAQPAADVLAFILAMIIMRRVLKKLDTLAGQNSVEV